MINGEPVRASAGRDRWRMGPYYRELPGRICTHDICPPWQGTRWNKIEHRLFAFITMNWRGKPLVSHQLIGATTTQTGLKVCCGIDGNLYPKGVNVTDQEMHAIRISRDEFHGEWNYTISPNQQPP
jgi:hypothetical protein